MGRRHPERLLGQGPAQDDQLAQIEEGGGRGRADPSEVARKVEERDREREQAQRQEEMEPGQDRAVLFSICFD